MGNKIKTGVALSAVIAFGGCSTEAFVFNTALQFVAPAAIESAASARAKRPPDVPRMIDQGGRHLQILSSWSGVFLQEYETASNQECLRLADYIGSDGHTQFKCTDLSAASSLGAVGTGKATKQTSGESYRFNSYSANVCKSLSANPDGLNKFKIECD